MLFSPQMVVTLQMEQDFIKEAGGNLNILGSLLD